MDRIFRDTLKKMGWQKIERRDNRQKPIHTHNLYDLRHSFATRIYKKTKSEIAVARLCRHTKIESAHIYTHLDTDDKKEIANNVFT